MKNSSLIFSLSIVLALLVSCTFSLSPQRPLNKKPVYRDYFLNPHLWKKAKEGNNKTHQNYYKNKQVQKKHIVYIGKNVFHDTLKNLYYNRKNRLYYDPKSGLVFKRNKINFINRNNNSTLNAKHKSNKKLEKQFRKLPKLRRRKNVKRIKIKRKPKTRKKLAIVRRKKAHELLRKCKICYRQSKDGNEKNKMTLKFMTLLNKYRKKKGLKEIRMDSRLNDITMIQSKYMKFVSKLNHDNFSHNLKGYKIGFETISFLKDKRVNDKRAPKLFLTLLKKNKTHNSNMLKRDINKCGFGVYYDAELNRYWATLICTD